MNELKILRPPAKEPETNCAFCKAPARVRKMVFVGNEGRIVCDACIEVCVRLLKEYDCKKEGE